MEGNEHAVIAVATFKNQAVNVRIPFEIPAKSMKNHDVAGSEVFGFIHFNIKQARILPPLQVVR